ncbi:hypothetical protein [Algoriphagus sp. NG3]|uniref:hypothetical protein n=1 Tax=unclassified Algoriphagus TaxID=2641541 RepID=UPI002A80C493|nr:hypothetical protein [Algoriphagus sp. NG3]WPR75078.1 hypothetical protein SLW71_20665 [Algoriphagus sp. NG3]
MKLADALLLSLSLALIIVGIHQTLTHGVQASYAIFMFAVALLFWFQYRKMQKPEEPPTPKKKAKSGKKR